MMGMMKLERRNRKGLMIGQVLEITYKMVTVVRFG